MQTQTPGHLLARRRSIDFWAAGPAISCSTFSNDQNTYSRARFRPLTSSPRRIGWSKLRRVIRRGTVEAIEVRRGEASDGPASSWSCRIT